jgi:hypothetical protein
MSSSQISQPVKISAKNIIKLSFEDLSAKQREAYEALKNKGQEQLEAMEKKSKEDFEALKKRQHDEDMEMFLGSFHKDRQGVVTLLEEAKLPPMLGDSA